MKWQAGLHLYWRKRIPVIRQTESAECGIACLAMIASWHGYQIDLASLRNRFNISMHGMTFYYLVECAQSLGLAGRVVRLELSELKNLKTPCILHWDLNHFVVLRRVYKNRIEINDPARGEISMTFSEVNCHFTGIALELSPTHVFEECDERRKVHLSSLIGKTVGLKSALVKIFCFTLALEVLALLGPLVNQIIIDEVLVAQDSNLLVIIIISMIIITTMQALLGLIRQWATISMAADFNAQWSANVFHHLLRLPIAWFEKRNIGDISAKFEAVDAIQKTLTTDILEALLDIVLIIGMLIMMILYNPLLTIIALAAAGVYGIMRMVWFSALRKAAENTWMAATKESSHFLETLNGMLSLRVNGALQYRESSWRNLNISRRNKQLFENKLLMICGALNIFIGSLVGASVLWFGATAVLNNQFSVGMLVAYLSFQGRFSLSVAALIDKIVSWKMLDVYNERLADIVLTSKESAEENCIPQPRISKEKAVIELNNVSFGYGDQYPVLSDVSFSIMPGEVVAIVGRSGSGKRLLQNSSLVFTNQILVTLQLSVLIVNSPIIFISDNILVRFYKMINYSEVLSSTILRCFPTDKILLGLSTAPHWRIYMRK